MCRLSLRVQTCRRAPGCRGGCRVEYYEPAGEGELPEITNASEIGGTLSGAADARLKEKIATMAEYNEFRAWALEVKGSAGKLAGAKAVLASSHAWASYVLGADTLLENEPTIRFVDFAAGARATAAATRDAAFGTLTVRVRVMDGGKIAKVDARKVQALFRTTADVSDWAKDAEVEYEVVGSEAGADGTLSFTVRVKDTGSGRAFLGVREREAK